MKLPQVRTDATTLRRRSPLLLAVIVLGVIGAVYVSSATILMSSFVKLEEENTRQNVKRVLDAIDHELEQLSTTVSDYAMWDDTYTFLEDGNPTYIDSNLSTLTFLPLKMQVMVLANRSQEIVIGRELDATTQRVVDLSADHLIQFQAVSQLLHHTDPQGDRSGLILLSGNPLLIASRPILTSEGKGPIRGSFMMGRYLNDAELQRITQFTRLSVKTYVLDHSNLPAKAQIALTALDSKQEIVMQPLDQQVIAGYTLIKDMSGKPILLLQVDLPRTIYNQGLISLRYLGLALLLVALLLGLVIWLLLQRVVKYIDERDRSQQALFTEKELAQITLHSIGDGVVTTDAAGRIQSLNPVAEKLTGWRSQVAQGLPLTEVVNIVDECTNEPIANLLDRVLQTRHDTPCPSNHNVLISRDGTEFAIDESIAPICDREGQLMGTVLVLRDVTQARQLARQLSWQACYDSLTGLVNRREFELRLEQAIQDAKTYQQEHSLCFLDLDRFKVVNDTCGHIAGDELLRQVSQLLQQKIRKVDIVARLGGDEFGILLYQCSLQQATWIAQALCNAVSEFRFVWQDKVFAIGASIGLTAINANSVGVQEVWSTSDTACYAAKQLGRGRIHIYQPSDRELLQLREEMQWINRIHAALEENRLCLYYQKIVPLNSVDSPREYYEVLLRLIDEAGQIILPRSFLPAAERYNLMPTIDRWVVQTVFHNLQYQYEQTGYPQINELLYTLNLSGASVNDAQFVHFLYEQFTEFQIPPYLICFEITETIAITNLSRALEFIRDLRSLGCRFALDDFGSGMSSFAYLKNFPVDYLKITGDLVKDVGNDPVALAMVRAINQIGHEMGIQTIAEFIANTLIHERITALGVDYGQGFSIGSPEPLPMKNMSELS
jgi:diguanylate cyclase (GGDEF)-like protein/PAS domain S-box-containing protein